MSSSLWITIEVRPGSNIPARVIPEMIALAEKLGCTIQTKCNGVTVIACPGDDPIDLAVSWEQEIARKDGVRIAVAWKGREHRVRKAALVSEEQQ